MMGSMNERLLCMLRELIEVSTKTASIMPSRHSKVDIRWDRYIRAPRRDRVKASIRLVWIRGIW